MAEIRAEQRSCPYFVKIFLSLRVMDKVAPSCPYLNSLPKGEEA
jgi:hypothetical protein